MEGQTDKYKTGEFVKQTGEYSCETGQKKYLHKNEKFPFNPSGGSTIWKFEKN